MFKKALSILLVLLFVVSVSLVGVNAADQAIADAGADADTADTGSGIIRFDAASAGWQDASSILFWIADLEEGELAAWGSKRKLGGTKYDNDIWAFDAAGLGVTAGHHYIIIFNNADTGAETYQLLLDTSCFGDTAYATGNYIENPVDSNKISMEARWKGSNLGPRLQITSIGSVVGESIPANTTAYRMFVDFLASQGKDGLRNALQWNNRKTAQEMIDSIASALGLSKEDVTKAINDAKKTGNSQTGDRYDWSRDWSASASYLPGGSSDSAGSSGSSSSSSSSSYTTIPQVSVSNDVDGVKISWTRVRGVNKYRVYTRGKSGWNRVADVWGNTYLHEKTKSGTKYTYTVRGISDDGSKFTSSYNSTGASITFCTAPKFSVSNATDGVKISWSKVTGAAKYRVYYKGKKGWEKIADTTKTSYVDTEVRSGNSYSYTVRCINAKGTAFTSAYRSGKSIKYVMAPKFSLSNTKKGVKISWSAVNGAAKYRVYRKSGSNWVKIADTTSASYVDTKVKSGSSYTYTVRCISANGKAFTSAYRAGKSIKYKAA